MSVESTFQIMEQGEKITTTKEIEAEILKINEEAGRGIFQQEKQEIAKRLKGKLSQLDKEKIVQWDDIKNRIVIKYDRRGECGKNFICDYKGKEYKLSLGDILADYNWGVKYMPDFEIPESIYRQISKRILINEARRNIEEIYDKEIIKNQLSSRESRAGTDHELAKFKIKLGKESLSYGVGHLNEEMVREFITRLSYVISEIADSEIKVIRSDIKEDVRQKIDFKILVLFRKKEIKTLGEDELVASHKRGIKTVDENELEKSVKQFQRLGFQLTTTGVGDKTFYKRLEHKAEQVERVKRQDVLILNVDDIVLLGLQMQHTRDLYNLWLSMGKPPGGPEQLWDIEQKKRVFRAITDKLKLDIPDGTLEKILK